jgi:CPA2 family monovalent cation:H+ antiporter-2
VYITGTNHVSTALQARICASTMHHHEILIFLAAGLAIAAVLGLITQTIRLSPIVGYLLAGIIVGPAGLKLVEDEEMAMQLGEIGVVLLMFGVGLHFNLSELWGVRKIALPGAVGQIALATLCGAAATHLLGWSLMHGVIVGMAISVASTVVLIRVLMDNAELETPQGHIAVGWLIVEDIFTVLALIVLPALAGILNQSDTEVHEGPGIWQSLGWAFLNIALLGAIVLGAGKRIIPWLLTQVARTRSRELFTLTILALALAIATGSAVFFGVSMALGAFLAGMVVGQSEMSHQAAADALPLRDAFAVIFFMYVGMELKPQVVLDEPLLVGTILAIILLVKPLVAFAIVWVLRYSFHTAMVVAVALSQIGEFSFLLATEAINHSLLPESGRSVLVACAIISITLNPLLFRGIAPFERWLRRHPALWKMAAGRSEAGGRELNRHAQLQMASAGLGGGPIAKAVIIGYGPVGKTAARILRDFGIEPVIADLNLDTVRELMSDGKLAVYGDATRRDILEAAGIRDARYLLVTTPEVLVRTLVVIAAKEINPELRVFVRARYINEREWLNETGASEVCIEEAETALGLAMLLLREVGADEKQIELEVERIHNELGINRRNHSDEAFTEFHLPS